MGYIPLSFSVCQLLIESNEKLTFPFLFIYSFTSE